MADSNILKILLVDDEEPLRNILRKYLESTDKFECTECESGEDAVGLLNRLQFDVIILDYKMQGISGLNVLQTMCEQKNETPALMLTAAGSENIAVEAMKLGAYDYLRKDQLDLEHLPIILNGIHERYLFRKERENNRLVIENWNTFIEILNTYRNSLVAYGLTAGNALTMLKTVIKESESNNPQSLNLGVLKQLVQIINAATNSISQTAEDLLKKFPENKKLEIKENVSGKL